MSALAWSEALALKQPRMDQTHREFVDLLQGLAAAAEGGAAALEPLLAELLQHTEQHFAQEEGWMADIGFARDNCHSLQHRQVLQALRQARPLLLGSDNAGLAQVLAEELGRWFVAHAQTMDAALATLMVEHAYDPDSGRMQRAAGSDAPAITGCGSSRCS